MQRYSRQREMILDYLCSTTAHPTAEIIYNDLKPGCPSLSLATVYRNLNLLADTGVIMKLDTGESVDRFDANTKNHYHFVCTCCHTVSDVFKGIIPDEILGSIVDDGYEITGHKLFIYGKCAKCKVGE